MTQGLQRPPAAGVPQSLAAPCRSLLRRCPLRVGRAQQPRPGHRALPLLVLLPQLRSPRTEPLRRAERCRSAAARDPSCPGLRGWM